jgi:hypothetical protein
LILFDDDEHFIQDSKTQRRFAPMLFTIDRNPRSRSSESAVLLDGRRVRVPEGFAAADLARVLAVLEGAVSC